MQHFSRNFFTHEATAPNNSNILQIIIAAYVTVNYYTIFIHEIKAIRDEKFRTAAR